MSKIFQKINISYLLLYTRTWAYQEVRNVRFLENFADVLNEWPQIFKPFFKNWFLKSLTQEFLHHFISLLKFYFRVFSRGMFILWVAAPSVDIHVCTHLSIDNNRIYVTFWLCSNFDFRYPQCDSRFVKFV